MWKYFWCGFAIPFVALALVFFLTACESAAASSIKRPAVKIVIVDNAITQDEALFIFDQAIGSIIAATGKLFRLEGIFNRRDPRPDLLVLNNKWTSAAARFWMKRFEPRRRSGVITVIILPPLRHNACNLYGDWSKETCSDSGVVVINADADNMDRNVLSLSRALGKACGATEYNGLKPDGTWEWPTIMDPDAMRLWSEGRLQMLFSWHSARQMTECVKSW